MVAPRRSESPKPPSPPVRSEAETYESFEAPHLLEHHAIAFGWLDRVEPSIMATCFPCFTIARYSTSTRLGFALVFLTVLVLYCGGITSFIVASGVADPVVEIISKDVSTFVVVAVAWASYIGGPWATLTVDGFLWFAWTLYGLISEGDPEDKIHAGTTSIILVAVHAGIQIVLGIVIGVVISKLRVRKPKSGRASFLWACYCCCCPSCALGSTVTSVKKANAASQDEIPGYQA